MSTDDANNDERIMCIVCWEDLDGAVQDETAIVKPCLHQACLSCIRYWIERGEASQQNEVSCPHCRQTMEMDNIEELLGRPYKLPPKDKDDGDRLVDGLTQAWLQQNDTHQCSNCGIWMVREEGDDTDAVMCLCGYCYCWTCDENGIDCDCGHEQFYDNLLDMEVYKDDVDDYPVATPEDLKNFGAFLQARQEAVWGKREEEEEPVVEEPAEVYIVALFDEYTEDAEACFTSFLEWAVDAKPGKKKRMIVTAIQRHPDEQSKGNNIPHMSVLRRVQSC